MLQYLALVVLWSVFYHVYTLQCLVWFDFNMIVYIIVAMIDSVGHAIKSHKTLKAEYHLITGRSFVDCFSFIWPTMHLVKKIFSWFGLGLLTTISPISCLRSPLTGSIFLCVSFAIAFISNRVRRLWINKYYQSVPVDDLTNFV